MEENETQIISIAKNVLNDYMNSTLIELDGYRLQREDIDKNYQQLNEQTLNNNLKSSNRNVIEVAKNQWKLDIYHKKAQYIDNCILKESIKFQIIATRLQKISLLSESDVIPRTEGSDILLLLTNNNTINQLDEENIKINQEIDRIEGNNKAKKQIDDSNEDLKQANHLLQESKRMDEKGLKGYSEIEKIIRNPSSKIGFNINRYINKYLEGEDDIPGIWDFIYAIRDQLLLSLPDFLPEQVEDALENYILPILHNKMMDDLNLTKRDKFVLSQCRKYGQTTQEQFKINPDFIDPAIVPYVKAIAELRSVYFKFSPSQKMSAILRAASAVYEVTGELQPKITMGGDDFIDIWVYVVLHSQLRNLPSIVSYISYYASEDLMTSEMGYYFTSLEVALNFIEKLTDENLTESPSAQITSRPFIICEKERYRIFCSVDTHIDLYKDNIELSGFKLYAIENWVSQPGRFYATYLQKTKNPKDIVKVAILKSNDTITPSQQSFIHDTFFRDKPEENLKVEDTMIGTVLCSNNPPDISLGPSILIQSGDYDKEINMVKTVVNLKILKINTLVYPPYISENIKTNFCNNFDILIQENNSFENTFIQFIKDIQIALKHLNIFPYLCVIDGIISKVLLKSIEIFQKQYNESTKIRYDGQQTSTMNFRADITNEERPSQLPSDGSLTPETCKTIKYRLDNLRIALNELGFDGVDNAIRQHTRFTEIIKQFQESCGIMPDGLLSEKTIRIIVTKWKEIKQNNIL